MTRLPWMIAALSVAAACVSPKPQIPYQHDRPIVERGDRTLLWAGEDDDWFDVTDAAIDPVRFQFGIGRDRIASIDEPIFVELGDPRAAEAGLSRATSVLGVVIDGVARAYPVDVLDLHEVVNDDFAGEPYAVLW